MYSRWLGGLKAASAGADHVGGGHHPGCSPFSGPGAPAPGAMPDWAALAVFAASLFALRRWKLNPVLLMAVTGALGLFLY